MNDASPITHYSVALLGLHEQVTVNHKQQNASLSLLAHTSFTPSTLSILRILHHHQRVLVGLEGKTESTSCNNEHHGANDHSARVDALEAVCTT